jgi:hypothetical protein
MALVMLYFHHTGSTGTRYAVSVFHIFSTTKRFDPLELFGNRKCRCCWTKSDQFHPIMADLVVSLTWQTYEWYCLQVNCTIPNYEWYFEILNGLKLNLIHNRTWTKAFRWRVWKSPRPSKGINSAYGETSNRGPCAVLELVGSINQKED